MSRRRRAPATETNELDNISAEQLQELNESFNSVFRKDQPPPSKKRRLDQNASSSASAAPDPSASTAAMAPGGFIIDEPAIGGSGGGFMIDEGAIVPESSASRAQAEQEEREHQDTDQDLIPLREIPRLLDLMNLPSDAEVLAAFETGAQSDDEDSDNVQTQSGAVSLWKGERVSRINFLRVAAILMANRSASDDDDSASEASIDSKDRGSDSGSEASFAPSAEEEGAAPSRNATRANTRASRRKRGGGDGAELEMLNDEDLSEDEEGVHRASSQNTNSRKPHSSKGKGRGRAAKDSGALSATQKQKAVDLFSAFLPEPDQNKNGSAAAENRSWDVLSQKSLGLNDIRRVAALIRVSLTDTEIKEMLEMASTGTSRDRVSMEDFVQVLQQIHAL